MNNIEEILKAIWIGLVVALFLLKTCRALQATELCNECLTLLNNLALVVEEQFTKSFYRDISEIIFNAYYAIFGYPRAKRYARKLIDMFHDAGILTIELGNIYHRQSRFVEAQELYDKAVNIMKTINHKRQQAVACGNLGAVFCSLCEYQKAKHYSEQTLAISMEIGDREGEAAAYRNLGNVFYSLCEYQKAKEYHEKALAITIEIGDRKGESIHYGNLGNVFSSFVNIRRLKNMSRKYLPSEEKLVTEMEKQ